MTERSKPNWVRRAAIITTTVGTIGYGVLGTDIGYNTFKATQKINITKSLTASPEELVKASEAIEVYSARVIKRDIPLLLGPNILIAAGIYMRVRENNRRKREETQDQQPSTT